MPCVGWIIGTERYSQDDVMTRARAHGSFHRIPAGVWAALWRATRREGGFTLSPSSATLCTRQRLLKASEDYWLNPDTVFPLLRGIGLHAALESGDLASHDEMFLSVSLSVKGIVIPLRGRLDSYDPQSRRLVDYKTTSRMDKPLPTDEHVTQLQLYALLLQENGYPVESALLWYTRMDASDWARKACDVALDGLDDIRMLAVDLAIPLAMTKITGILPACTCRYRGYGLDRDLCLTVNSEEWTTDGYPRLLAHEPDRVAVPG
jgi:hypothetical protein